MDPEEVERTEQTSKKSGRDCAENGSGLVKFWSQSQNQTFSQPNTHYSNWFLLYNDPTKQKVSGYVAPYLFLMGRSGSTLET